MTEFASADVDFHRNPIVREIVILGYLERRLTSELINLWENHYLVCDDCFEEMCASQLLKQGLSEEYQSGQMDHRLPGSVES